VNTISGLRTYRDAVAIITGGASGIGRALAEALAERGADVVIADLQGDLGNEIAAGIRARGGHATAHEIDVTDFEALERLVQDTAAAKGRLDYICNNAGIGIGGEVRLHQIEDWNRIIDVNLRGVANGVQAAYPAMLRQGFGHIVNTASMAGLMPCPGLVSYSAVKHAVVGLSTSLRVEAAAAGVRVSVLCPGVIQTPILYGGGKHGKMLEPLAPEKERAYWQRLRPMPAERFAAKALRAIAKNKAIIIIPSWWKMYWWLNRLSPSLGLWMARRLHSWARRALTEAADATASEETVALSATAKAAKETVSRPTP
jgi:NAD(P)-dependent dehydrogenase (short-subunit alcohol dehydrogenase family)